MLLLIHILSPMCSWEERQFYVLFICFYWNDDTHCFFLQFWKPKKGPSNFFLMCTIYGPKWKQAKFWEKKCLNAPNFSNEIFKKFFLKFMGFLVPFCNLGPIILITIKIYTLIREESLCSFCYEIPCNMQKKRNY